MRHHGKMLMQNSPHPLDLREIRTAQTGLQLDTVVKKLIEQGALTDSAVSEIEKKIEKGYIPRNDIIIYFIINGIIPSLYKYIKPNLRFRSSWDTIELYTALFPDREIEEILIEKLYDVGMSADQPVRRYIVEAMIGVGSTACIATLKTIEEELRNKAAAAKIGGDLLPFPENVVASSQSSFYELICEAIDVVTARGSAPAPVYSSPAPIADDSLKLAANLQKLDDTFLRNLEGRIKMIELALRTAIVKASDGVASRVPPHLINKMDERIEVELKKNSALDARRLKSLAGRLEFADLRDVQEAILGAGLWQGFESWFSTKPMLIRRFDQLADLRNSLAHSRTLTDVVLKDGEAAIHWFEGIIEVNTGTAGA